MSELQERIAAIKAKKDAGEDVPLEETCQAQQCYIRELKTQLRDETAARARAESELRECRERLAREGALRPSIEVLQRMANGIDAFDLGRFKCAVAALPHETPKLSASVGVGLQLGIGDRLEALNRRAAERGLRLIDAEAGG